MKFKFPWQKLQMIKACRELARMRLWENYENLDFFAVETPLEEPVVVSIMGAGGEEYGISVFRGEDAFTQPIKITTNDRESAAEQVNTIGFSMVYYKDMQHQEKKWLKSCNYRAKSSDWLPSVISKKPGEMIEMVEKNRDIKLMLYIVKGIIKAEKEGKFCPIPDRNSSKIFTLEVSGDVSDPDVKATHKSFPGSQELLDMCGTEISELPDISELPKLDQTWVVVPVYMPGEDDLSDECILVIAEEDSYYILHTEIIAMNTAEVIDVLFSVFSGDNDSESIGVPETLIIAEKELFNAVQDIQEMGINIRCEGTHPVAKDIRENITQILPDIIDEYLKMSDIDLSVVPADDDLQGWKLVQSVITAKFVDFWNDSDYLRKGKVSRKFFGDRNWEYYIDEYNGMAALPSYVTWAALTYRKRKNKPTFAEKLLAEDIPESLRISLESLNNSYPSLYQVQGTEPDTGYVHLKDLLLSEEITIQDYSVSETAEKGWIVTLWVYPAGNFHFADVAGPAFSALNSTEVITELQKLKLPTEPTPRWLRENAHIFGRLWAFYDEIATGQPVLPKLNNTDGDPLEFITAYFECEDVKRVRKELSDRSDIDYDKEDDIFIWFKSNADNQLMEKTLLARIYLQDKEIEVETNSQTRLNSLIDMLETIEGIHYLRYESKDIAQMLKEAPESREGITEKKLPEEVKQAVQDNMKKYYIDWLDKPNPALGNKTPRQAAKSKKTAQKTRILIETIPAPASSDEIKIPKKEMLKSIGLDK